MRLIFAAALGLAAASASAEAAQQTLSYNVSPGACGQPIAVPANNKPVVLSGTNIQSGNRGTGMVSLIRANANNNPLLLWAGIDYAAGDERGLSSGAGAGVIYLDGGKWVTVQTAGSTHLQVCNSSSNVFGNAIGYLTFTY